MEAKRGAVAVLDALGFKGIWKRRDAKAVLDRMRVISTESKRLAEQVWTTGYQSGAFGPWRAKDMVRLEPKVVHFSDSVIVCCESASAGEILPPCAGELFPPRD